MTLGWVGVLGNHKGKNRYILTTLKVLSKSFVYLFINYGKTIYRRWYYKPRALLTQFYLCVN